MNCFRTLLCALLLGASAGIAADTQRVIVGDFSRLHVGAPLAPQWRKLSSPRIKRHTQYTLESIEGLTVLHAHANASMSSLATESRVDPAAMPWIHWRWRIASGNPESKLNSKPHDDFAARIYVFFDFDLGRLPFFERAKLRLARTLYGKQLPLAALCYVWTNDEPVGTTTWNAYTDRVRMVVATSSNAITDGGMVAVTRNVYEDYRNAFGEPVPIITGIALATDSDDTGVISEAWYGDIYFSSDPSGEVQ